MDREERYDYKDMAFDDMAKKIVTMQAEVDELRSVMINVAADITREFVEGECTDAQHRRLVALILKLRDAALPPPEKIKH